MKLYDFQLAPNPRRVRIFAAEKGLTLETQQVNLREGEQLQAAFLARNPRGMVPWLELDNGGGIGEVIGIWRYLEEIQPAPSLLGDTPESAGRTIMWCSVAENEGFNPLLDAVHNEAPNFAGRAAGGLEKVEQIPELGPRGRIRLGHFYEMLDGELAGRPYVAGEAYSAADITTLVTIDFAAARLEVTVPDDHANLKRWYDEVSSRPSARA